MDNRDGIVRTTPTVSLEGLCDLLTALEPELSSLPGLVALFSGELERALTNSLSERVGDD